MFLAKILSGREINSFEQFPQAQFCYNRSPCSTSSHSSSGHPSPPVASTKSAARKPRPQTTSLGVEKKEPPTQADKMRSVLLDRSQSILVGVEEFPAVGETRNRRAVAFFAPIGD
jgi:hypothetical protein